MRCLALLGCWLMLGGGAALGDTAQAELPPKQKEQARALVQRLAHRSFKVREQATEQLERLGRPARAVLEEGVKYPDAEVRRRCRRLLDLALRSDTEIALAEYLANKSSARLLKLPSWGRFSKMVGKDDVAKRLFVDMFCSEGTMLAELETQQPQQFATRLQGRLMEIQRTMWTPAGQASPPPHGQVVALLFMATDARLGDNVQSFYALNNLFYQPTVQQSFKNDPGSRKLLVSFLETRSNPTTIAQAFYIAQQMQLKEALPLALKTVKATNIPAYTRGMAVLFVGRMGAKDHRKDLEALLEDKTAMGAVNTGQVTVNAQLRDVALAALVQLAGQDVHTYDFPAIRNFHGTPNLPPYYYGFTDDKGREAALKKWKASQPPPPPIKK
jgi:hypothetical protein